MVKKIDEEFEAKDLAAPSSYDDGIWYASLGDLSSARNMHKSWSNDESTVYSSSRKSYQDRQPRNQPSFESSVASSHQSSTMGFADRPNFQQWLKRTSNFTHMLSNQINACTAGAKDVLSNDQFTLKDEDFFWNATTNRSFDTIATRETYYQHGQNRSFSTFGDDNGERHGRRYFHSA